MTLYERCENFRKELGTPLTVFLLKIGISKTAYYRWRDGNLALGKQTLARIENYISKYGF